MKITREELERAGFALSQGIDTVPQPLRASSRTRSKNTVGQSLQRIVEFVRAARGPVTRAQIAAELGMKKSPYLLSLIDRLVQEETLIETRVAYGSNSEICYYRSAQ